MITLCSIKGIAYQESDSLLASKGVSLIYSLNNTVTLTYGITVNQSDKLSSGYLVNILAQQSAKTLADVSAKIYANQSPKFTGNQSGEYFSGCNSGGYLSTPKRGSAKRGEFTPFAKGDFSHLSKVGKSRYLNSFISKNGKIEFCESIKGTVIEFLQSIKGKIIEFFESIKKGSQSATLGNVDIKYRASENINISLLLWYGKYQPFGSIPRFLSSFLASSLNQFARLTLSFAASTSNCCRKSGCILIWNVGDCPPIFGVLSFTLDIVRTLPFNKCYIVRTLYHVFTINKTPPNNATNTIRGLITTDNEAIEVTMSKFNTPVTGRTSLTPNKSYRWLFLALNRSDYTAKPCRIAVIAPNENSARLMLVRDYMLIFAGRLPVQGVAHA